MPVAETIAKFGIVMDVLKAASVLEHQGLLPKGESVTDVVKRYAAANPDINEVLRELPNNGQGGL